MTALGDRAAPERPEDRRDRRLPDDLLPAGRRAAGGRGAALDLAAEPAVRPGQPGPRGRRASTDPQWFYDPAWAKAGIILMPIWGVGDVVDHLPRRAPGRLAAPVRGGRGRRRRPLGEGPPRDDPDDQPGDPVQPHHRRDRGVPVLHPGVRRSARARSGAAAAPSAGQNSLLFYGLDLYNNAFRYFQHGLRLGARLGPAARSSWPRPWSCSGSRAAGSTTRGALDDGGASRPRPSPRSAWRGRWVARGTYVAARGAGRCCSCAVPLDGLDLAQDRTAGRSPRRRSGSRTRSCLATIPTPSPRSTSRWRCATR